MDSVLGWHVTDRAILEEMYDLFELAIKELLASKASIPGLCLGRTATWHQEKWHDDAVELLIDKYFLVASRYDRPQQDCERPFRLTFELSLVCPGWISPTKALKHVTYYSKELVVLKSERGRLHELDGLETFLRTYLANAEEKLLGKLIADDEWKPASRVLEFMVKHEYYRKELLAVISTIQALLDLRLEKIPHFGSLEHLRTRCLHEQANALCKYVLETAQRNLKLVKD